MSQSESIGNSASGSINFRKMFSVPYSVLTVIVIVILWQVATDVFKLPKYLLPSPYMVLQNIIQNWQMLAANAGVTTVEVLVGFVISVLIGVPLAICISYSTVIDRSIYPLIVASQTIPKVAIAPLLLAWFGFGISPKIMIVVLVAFFPIVINAVVGLRSSPIQMLYLGQSMGATPWQMFWKFRLPEALPSIFAGMKMASVMCITGAVVAEFVGAQSGLGYLILIAGANFNLELQFSSIFLLSLLGMAFFAVIGVCEKAALPWHISVRSQGE